MKPIFYYISDDPANPKGLNEIEFLSTFGYVVVVSCRGQSLPPLTNIRHVKRLVISSPSRINSYLYYYWSKFCYLFSKSSSSINDKNFPVRNIYTGSLLLRAVINFFWHIKYKKYIFWLLPSYEALFFFPFKIVSLFKRPKKRHGKYKRILVHDSIILRLLKFLPFFSYCRHSKFISIAHVKSWDNPFYSHLIDSANGYLVWSHEMWSHLNAHHNIKTQYYCIWGPRLFYEFEQSLLSASVKSFSSSKWKNVGYAAAFPEPFMARHEVNLIFDLACKLEAEGSNLKILYRPYPIIDQSVYKSLFSKKNIEVVEINGPIIDRFNDGTTHIKFGSNEERMSFLSKCDCFLSLGTSFTFEAALYGLPLFQYYLPTSRRFTKHEHCIFELYDISDHLLHYFSSCLPLVDDSLDLTLLVNQATDNIIDRSSSVALLNMAGFIRPDESLDFRFSTFIDNLQL